MKRGLEKQTSTIPNRIQKVIKENNTSKEELIKICNSDPQFAQKVLKKFRGVGRTAQDIISFLKASKDVERTTDIFTFSLVYANSGEYIEKVNTLKEITKKNTPLFENDLYVISGDCSYLLNVTEPDGSRVLNKLRCKFTEYVIDKLLARFARLNRKETLPALKRAFTDDTIREDPFGVLTEYGLTKFVDIDSLALHNKWWEAISILRASSAIIFFWNQMSLKEKCTACSMNTLWTLISFQMVNSITFDIFNKAFDSLVKKKKFMTYQSGEIVTSAKFFKLETDISSLACHFDDECTSKQHEGEYDLKEFGALEYDSKGNFTDNQLELIIERACSECFVDNPCVKPTVEQKRCVLTILKNRFSMLNAKGGTGKTDVVLRIVTHILSRLAYDCMIAVTPTHAAKKPIRALHSNGLSVETIQCLTFYCGKGTGLYRNHLTKAYENGDYDENSETDPHRKSKFRIFVVLDESSMYCSENVGTLFGELYARRDFVMAHVCMMGDTGQLTPISAGTPFEDLVNSGLFPVEVLTKSHRSDMESLSAFCDIYRGNQPNWIFKKYVTDTPQVVHVESEDKWEDVNVRYGKLLSELSDNGVNLTEIMTITPENLNCITLSHIARSIFNPEIEETRRKKVHDIESNRSYKDFNSGLLGKRWGRFAQGDTVSFTKNCMWYKNGDTAAVVEETHNVLPNASVVQTCTVRITVDTTYNELLHRASKSLKTLGDTFWTTLKDLPNNLKYVEELKDDNNNIVGGVWQFDIEAQDLKPTSCITSHKSQGDQSRIVIFVLPRCLRMMDCRSHYTPCSRAKSELYLMGPTKAFDNAWVRQQTTLPTTLLQSIFPSTKECDNSILTSTERFAMNSILKSYNKNIPQSIRRRVWERDCRQQINGKCGCCGKHVRFDDSDWNVCHVVARAVDETMAFDEENMRVGCRECNVKMHIQNFFEYKNKLMKERR